MKAPVTAKSIVIAGLALVLSAGLADAQRGPGKGTPKYDPASVVTLQGTVTDVTQQTGSMGWSGTHLAVKTEDSTLDVHLGPTAFLADQGFQFAIGDEIEVSGSKTKYNGADAVIAREVKKGGKVLTLRDEQGFPKWSRNRWRW